MKKIINNKFKYKNNPQIKSGFTLLEALVSIAIVLIAVSTSFTIIPQGQTAIRHIRNEITATYLAQEAVEVVRNHRDKYMSQNFEGAYKPDWKAKLIPGPVNYNRCITEVGDPFVKQCMVNSFTGTQSGGQITDQFILCDQDPNPADLYVTNCRPLQSIDKDLGGQGVKIYGNNFNLGDQPVDTIFTRWVEIKAVPNETAGRWEQDATTGNTNADPNIVKNDVEMRVVAHVIWKDKGSDRSFSLTEDLFYSRRPPNHGSP